MNWKFEEEFRNAHPETIGESDKRFDLDNYKDWLEEQLTIARKMQNDDINPAHTIGDIVTTKPYDDGVTEEKIVVGEWYIFEGYKSLARAAHGLISKEKAKCIWYNSVDDKFGFLHPNNEERRIESDIVHKFYSKPSNVC